jgi:hypothetical protein
MDSEKAMYWMAVGVLALAVTNGLMTGYNGWASRLADKSIAMAEQASEIGSSYLNTGYLNLGHLEVATADRRYGDLQRVAQVNMACVRSTMARHTAEIARAQAQAIRAQMVEHRVHAIVQGPRSRFVIDVPDQSEVSDDDAN